jgi:hypothetical protein
MARTVREAMNSEVFSVGPDELTSDVFGYLIALGVQAAPVVDDAGVPLGLVSLRDLRRVPAGPVKTAMSRPPVTVRDDAGIEEAGRLQAVTGLHHLVVVDRDGRTVGVISSLDVVRALLDMPGRHVETGPHPDQGGLAWSDDLPLAADRVESAPAGPGVVLLVQARHGLPDRTVWIEATANLRARLLELATAREPYGELAAVLRRPGLRFRVAATESLERARELVDLRLRSGAGPRPQA